MRRPANTLLGPADLPVPTLSPLVVRLDHIGLVEHAHGVRPTAVYGHCTDDAGRALGIAAQLRDDPDAPRVVAACVRQLGVSLRPDGRFTLRLDVRGAPTLDDPSDDATARALWGLAHVTTASFGATTTREVERLLAATAGFVSPFPRAAAHAVLAATVLLDADPTSVTGRRLLHDNRPHLPRPPGPAGSTAGWRWPEPRLTYGNGLLCEALLAGAHADGDEAGVLEALDLLRWLVATERSPDGGDHFSFTPTTGRGPGDGPGFDQQPIEAWTLASACRAAADLTHDPSWTEPIVTAAAWFAGANDLGVPMWDERTGAAFDGLTALGPNRNEGTESTLALLGTLLALGPPGYAAPRRDSR